MVQSYSPGGANEPSHVGTLAPPGECKWTCASLGLPRVHNPNGKSIGSAVSAQLTAESHNTSQWVTFPMGDLDPHLIHDSFGQFEPTIQTASRSVQLFLHRWLQRVAIFYNWHPFPQNCPFPWEDLDSHMTRFLGPQTTSLLVQPFCTDDHSVTTYFTMGRPSPLKISPSHGDLEPPWFPGPNRVLNPNSILIASAIFAGLTSVTDQLTNRPTDYATRSVTIGHIYVPVCSTAMRPNNSNYGN